MPAAQLSKIILIYEDVGSGPALLFLHGLGSRGRDWSPQIEHFKKQYRVLVPDLRGHGLSDKPLGTYSIATIAQDIHELLQYLEITTITIIGLSLGGFVALELTHQYPEKINRLVLVSTSAYIEQNGWQKRSLLQLRKVCLNLLPLPWVAWITAYYLFPEKSQKDLRLLAIKQIASNPPKIYQACLQACLEFDARTHLEKIRCPTLIVVGEKDHPMFLRYANQLHQSIAQAKLQIIQQGRHMNPIDSSQMFNQVVEQFLQQTP